MFVGSSETAAPGRTDRPETRLPAPCLTHHRAAWGRRAVLILGLVVGAWLLLVAWSGAARADDGSSEESSDSGTETTSWDIAVEDTSESDSADAPPPAPAPEPAPEPAPAPAPVTVTDTSGAVPDQTSTTAQPTAGVPAPTVESTGSITTPPAVDMTAGLVGSATGVPDPALLTPAPVIPVVVDPVPVPLPPVDLGAVAGSLVHGPVTPILCSAPEPGPLGTADADDAARGDSFDDGTSPSRNSSDTDTDMATAATAATAAVSAEGASAPVVPVSPPVPVSLPAPVPAPAPVGPAGPAGPAGHGGPAAAASYGSSSYSAGSDDHADDVEAALVARVTASLAQAALRHASGFGGAVVGGADDPGVRPG